MLKRYKVNLHVLEACNFRCFHCFSRFGSNKIMVLEDWKQIVDNCMESQVVSEFNIAGGEPLLYKDLIGLAKYIREKGAKVSIITNGFLMNEEWIQKYGQLFSTIGFSVDSVNDETNQKIGRCINTGSVISASRVTKLCELIRKYVPDCKIKINTVVTTRNRDEQLSDFIDTIKPDRWKILKMKTFVYGTFSNMSLQVSAAEFDEFVRQNKIVNEKTRIVVEPDMKASYILIDPNGWLLDNAANEMTPVEICDCRKEKLKEGLKKLTLDEKRYCNRYAL